MGKKEINKGSNIDTYRKRIGKQEHKVNKSVAKSLKDTAEAKQSSIGIKDVLLVLVAIFVLLSSIYLLFYLSFQQE